MTTYYLIRGDTIVATIEAAKKDRVALPLLGGGEPMSLMNATHAETLMGNTGAAMDAALAMMGIVDMQEKPEPVKL